MSKGGSGASSGPCPVYQFRPSVLKRNLRAFLQGFPGTVAYAVKANTDPQVLEVMLAEGIDVFDVASLSEVKLMSRYAPQARLMYMNPVKSPADIREAYFQYGVRTFSLDAEWELEKVLSATEHASDLALFLRIAVNDAAAKVGLSSKFGLPVEEAPALLKRIKATAAQVGVCFHVGSQCEDKAAFTSAIADVAGILDQLPFQIDALDVGGGFPADYLGKGLHSDDYFREIQQALDCHGLTEIAELICEPGRALVASCESLVVTVTGRKGNLLYINDGVFGGIFEPADDFQFPARLLRQSNAPLLSFSLFGPTCDSTDKVRTHFCLPGDIGIDDRIELGHMGAYSKALRTNFNGFGEHETVVLDEEAAF